MRNDGRRDEKRALEMESTGKEEKEEKEGKTQDKMERLQVRRRGLHSNTAGDRGWCAGPEPDVSGGAAQQAGAGRGGRAAEVCRGPSARPRPVDQGRLRAGLQGHHASVPLWISYLRHTPPPTPITPPTHSIRPAP
ncbi:hypothetical protein O3P69_001476 [Scylla paramamosain]|uniref:Uncharacterized protein n=1 Tax=Scylla paramamosain TaxID=85552 RepID=A0AAW0V0S9_SCYPA